MVGVRFDELSISEEMVTGFLIEFFKHDVSPNNICI